MATIPTQEEILAATRKSQEAMIAAIKNWFETVRTVTPKLTSVYAPLTERLPRVPVSLPFADKLPTPEEAVGNAYHMAEQLLASQRKFTEDLLEAMTPLIPGRSEAAPAGNGSNEPKVPSNRVWQEAVVASEPKLVAASEAKPVAASEAKPVVASEAKPVVASEAKPVVASEAKPVAASQPKPVVASQPKPVVASEAGPAAGSEPTVAAASAEPKATSRPAAKSTPARTAPRSTTAARSTAGTRSTAAKSGAAKGGAAESGAATSGTGTDTPKRASGSRTPKGPDAH
jgi:outer membrane biosynthesis protein TonB